MKLSLWDTAGQETYKSVTRSYFRGASGALLVFDLTRRDSFTHVTDWLNDLRQIAEPDIVVVLVGNKSDLVSDDDKEEEEEEENQINEHPSMDPSSGSADVSGGGGESREGGTPSDSIKDHPPPLSTSSKSTNPKQSNTQTTTSTEDPTGKSIGQKKNKRQITRKEAERWSQENDLLCYVETSAKSGANVEQAFLELANRIYQNIEAGKYDLNDRRSGVKGASTAGGTLNGRGRGGAGAVSPARTVRLGLNDYDNSSRRGGSGGWGGGGCC